MASLLVKSARLNTKLLINQVQQKFISKPKHIYHLCNFSTSRTEQNKKDYEVTFVLPNGDKIRGKGKDGDSLLDVVVNNDLDFDGYGACEGTLTCSTCHVILKKTDYDKLPEKPTEEENDMLDLAFGLTETSRLGCQIQLTKDLDGLEVEVPASVNDARS